MSVASLLWILIGFIRKSIKYTTKWAVHTCVSSSSRLLDIQIQKTPQVPSVYSSIIF